MSDVEAVVRRYFAVVADLAVPPEALRDLLHDDVRIHEHPNLVTPTGGVRDRDAAVAGYAAGKQLLSRQSIEVHEVLVSGSRAAVRATWRGTVAGDAGPFRAGAELVAYIAGWLTVEDGRVREHETFDCYEPFGP
jgi:ketosteroid isomerase-like protein